MGIQAVLFDLDDTLLDRDSSIKVFVDRLVSDHAGGWDADGQSALRTAFLELDERGYRPRDELFALLAAIRPGRLQLDAETFLAYWNEVFPMCAVPMPGLYAVLDGLAARNIRAGLVTNGTSILQNAKIDRLGIRKSLQVLVISEIEGIRKPDPEIYRRALDRLGADAAATLFVGDHPVVDVQGALSAGLTSVWLGRGQAWPVADFRPDRIIHALAELLTGLD